MGWLEKPCTDVKISSIKNSKTEQESKEISIQSNSNNENSRLEEFAELQNQIDKAMGVEDPGELHSSSEVDNEFASVEDVAPMLDPQQVENSIILDNLSFDGSPVLEEVKSRPLGILLNDASQCLLAA